MKFRIYLNRHGLWVAENSLGVSIWSMTREELFCALGIKEGA